MDIHREVDNIVAGITQPQQLRFEFHQNGCTIVLSNTAGEHKHELAPYDLLWLGIERNFLQTMMEMGTVAFFTQEPQS